MASPKKPSSRNTTVNARRLEKLIRDTVRSEIAAQQSRKNTTDSYTQKLHETDKRITEFIQQAITETTHAHRISVDSLFIGYLAAVFILVAGLTLAVLSVNSLGLFTIAVFFVAIGGIWIIHLQSRNLSKNNRLLVNNLAKINIIFASYIRQIHQVDTVFEEIAGSDDGITVQTVEQLLNNLQEAMTEAMNSIAAISIDSEE